MSKHKIRRRLAGLQRTRATARQALTGYAAIELSVADHMFGKRRRVRRTLVRLVEKWFHEWPQ